MDVRQRYFRGWNEKQIPITADPEKLCLEFWQLARRLQRFAVDEKRRDHLEVAVLACVQIEHQIDERSREPRARTEQQREPGARHLRRAFEVKNSKRRTQVPMRERFEIER